MLIAQRGWTATIYGGNRHAGTRAPASREAIPVLQTTRGFRLCLLLWLIFLPVILSAASFTAALDRDTITLGESARLSLSFSGGNPQNVPAPPAIPNLQIQYVGPSSQFTMINGQMSSVVTYNFNVTPHQAGDFQIPALAATVGSETLRTAPLTLRVLKPTATTPNATNTASWAFLRLLMPKKELYVGETVVAQLHLYLRRGVQEIHGFQLTSVPADGLLTGKMVEGQRTQTQIGNAVFTVIPLLIPVKALKAGPLTFGPVTASTVIEVPSGNRGRDPFEGFGFRGMFDMFGGERKQIALATEAEQVQALPLPQENRPPSFNGVIGAFRLGLSAGPTNVAVGDPITIKVAIAGKGALDSITLPEQPGWRDFKTYPPTSKVEPTDALGLEGTKLFEQIVVPESPELKELPPFTLSFFDPEKRAYQTLTHPALPLVVRPAGALPAPTVAAGPRNAEENAPPAQDIVHIKQRLGSLAQIGPPLIERPWFLAAQSVPVLAFVAALVWRKRADQLARNPRLRRQRHVAQLVREGLADLRRFAAENKSEEFFATLFRLLQEQLGERLDLPASSITEAVIEEQLRPRGVPDPVIAPIQDLFNTCNLARYAPIRTSQELSALVPKIEQALHRLQEVKL